MEAAARRLLDHTTCQRKPRAGAPRLRASRTMRTRRVTGRRAAPPLLPPSRNQVDSEILPAPFRQRVDVIAAPRPQCGTRSPEEVARSTVRSGKRRLIAGYFAFELTPYRSDQKAANDGVWDAHHDARV